MSTRPILALLIETSPRRADWLRVFGQLEIPIRSSIPHRADLPGRPAAEVYLVDVERLTEAQFDRAVAFLAERFGVPEAEVRAGLRDPEHGLPLLAEDVIVAGDLRHVL